MKSCCPETQLDTHTGSIALNGQLKWSVTINVLTSLASSHRCFDNIPPYMCSLSTSLRCSIHSFQMIMMSYKSFHLLNHTTTTILRPFIQDHPSEPVPEENFWTLWCKARLTHADTPTIRLGTTPSGLTSAHLHHLPIFFTGRMPFLPPNQQCQSTEGN